MKREIERISDLLKTKTIGMTISGISRKLGLNRNTVAKYLDIMLTTGDVEMRQIGSAKLYSLSHRLPLAALLDASSDAIAVLDGNLMIIQSNDSFSKLLNVSKSDVIGMSLRDTPFSSNAGSEIERKVLDSLSGDHSISEFRYSSETGSMCLNVSSLPIILGDGSHGACLIAEDITIRKLTEEAIKESEEKYRFLFNNLSDFVFLVDSQGHFIELNETGLKTLGYSMEELRNMTPEDLETPDIVESVEERIGYLLEHKKSTFETKLRSKKGKVIPVEAHNSLITYKGEPAIIGVVRDFSEREQTEKTLRESEEKYRYLFNNLSDFVFLLDQNGKFIEMNETGLKILGRTMKELQNMSPTDLEPPEIKISLEERLAQIVEHKQITFESKVKTKDGKIIPVESQNRLITYKGEPAILSIGRDYSEREKAEKALKESEERMEFALRGANLGTWDWDAESGINHYDERYLRILGYKKSEFDKSYQNFEGWSKLLHPDDRDNVAATWADLSEGRMDFVSTEHRLMTKSGEYKWVLSSGGVVEYDAQGRVKRTSGTMMDINERKQAEKALEASEDRFRATFYESPIGIALYDASGILIHANKTLIELAGVKNEKALIGIDIFKNPNISEKDAERIRQSESFVVEPTIDFDIIKKEKYYKTSKQGKGIARIFVSPLGIDEHGKPTGFILQYKDITAQRQAEMQLETSNRFHQTILNKIVDIVVVFDKDDTISYINDAGKRIFGESGEILREFPDRTEVIGEHFERMQKLYLKAKENRKSERFESLPLISSSGDIAYQSGWFVPLIKNNQYDGMVITSTDVTEREMAREKEQQHIQFMETVIESLVHPFYVIDANSYEIMMANSASKLGELGSGSTCYSLTHLRDSPCGGENHPCPIEKVKKTKKPVVVEHIHRNKDGDSRYFQIHAYPIFDADREITAVIEYGLDITEFKKNERELKINESRYRSLFENSSLALWEEDYSEVKNFFEKLKMNGIINFRQYFESHPEDVERCVGKVKVLDANKVSLNLHGVQTKDEVLGYLSKSFGKDGFDVFREELIALAEGRTYYQSDSVQISVRGKQHILVFQLNVPPGFEDSLAKVYLSIIDMTELFSIQDALRTSEERNRKIVDNIAEGVNLLEINSYTIRSANSSLCKLLGYTEDELIGMRVHDIHPKEEIDQILKVIDALGRGEDVEEGVNVPMLRKDGKIIHVTIKTALIAIDGVKHLLGFFSLPSRINETDEPETSSDQNQKILQLEEQIKNEKLLRHVAERSFNTTNFEQFVYQFLSDVGSHFDADRVGIFIIDPTTQEGSFRYEWCARGTPKIMNKFQSVTDSDFLKEMMESTIRQPLVIADIYQIPSLKESQRTIFRSLDITSLLTVPFHTYNNIRGLLGISSSEVREFSDLEQNLLKELTLTLSQKMEYHEKPDE